MRRFLDVEVAGERLQARGDKTVFWPAQETLFVADLHLGKGAAFRAGGVPVPQGSTAATLFELASAMEETQARRLLVLGDLWHARAGRTGENVEALKTWLAERPQVEAKLILGNHDRGEGWELEAVAPGLVEGPFALHHFPDPDPRGYTLCGHLHPGVSLPSIGRLPCFWFGERVGVLPAFGDLTGTMEVRPRSGDRTVVIAEGKVALVPPRDRFRTQRR